MSPAGTRPPNHAPEFPHARITTTNYHHELPPRITTKNCHKSCHKNCHMEEKRMDLTDRVLNLDWSNAEHAGGGVYVLDATHRTGIPSLAVRADRGGEHHVILMEKTVFKNLTRYGTMLMDRQDDARQAGIVTHATPYTPCTPTRPSAARCTDAHPPANTQTRDRARTAARPG